MATVATQLAATILTQAPSVGPSFKGGHLLEDKGRLEAGWLSAHEKPIWGRLVNGNESPISPGVSSVRDDHHRHEHRRRCIGGTYEVFVTHDPKAAPGATTGTIRLFTSLLKWSVVDYANQAFASRGAMSDPFERNDSGLTSVASTAS